MSIEQDADARVIFVNLGHQAANRTTVELQDLLQRTDEARMNQDQQ